MQADEQLDTDSLKRAIGTQEVSNRQLHDTVVIDEVGSMLYVELML